MLRTASGFQFPLRVTVHSIKPAARKAMLCFAQLRPFCLPSFRKQASFGWSTKMAGTSYLAFLFLSLQEASFLRMVNKNGGYFVPGFSVSVSLGNKLPSVHQQKKPGTSFLAFLCSGGRIRTSDLWVMSPTSYLCSTPQCFQCANIGSLLHLTKKVGGFFMLFFIMFANWAVSVWFFPEYGLLLLTHNTIKDNAKSF